MKRYVVRAKERFPTADGRQVEHAIHSRDLRAISYVTQVDERFATADGRQVERAFQGRDLQTAVKPREGTTHAHGQPAPDVYAEVGVAAPCPGTRS